MFTPANGQIIKLQQDVEIEMEDGYIFRIEAGEELEVVEYFTDSPEQTPNEYYEKYGVYNVDIKTGDLTYHNPWDRSGQSDYEIDLGTTNIDFTLEDLQD
jgi:hypothetical protein